tara:strand:+ start:937 stop:1119 length:183 start_codon:yes stop_codon:yes gene_type:complete
MTQEEASASIAYLADKLSKCLSRLYSVERELKNHLDCCKCHDNKIKTETQDSDECEMCSA